MRTDKLSMRSNTKDKHVLIKWLDPLSPQRSRQTVITVFRSIWRTIKINGVSTDLFCTGGIDHPRCMFLN